MLRYPARYEKDGDGYFLRFVDVPDAITEGDTIEELIENAEDAISLYLGALFDDGKPIPEPSVISGDDILYIDVEPGTAIPILLKKMRKEANLTQKEMADKVGQKSHQAYQKLEQVQGFNPTVKTLERIAQAIGKKLVIDFVDRETAKEPISLSPEELFSCERLFEEALQPSKECFFGPIFIINEKSDSIGEERYRKMMEEIQLKFSLLNSCLSQRCRVKARSQF